MLKHSLNQVADPTYCFTDLHFFKYQICESSLGFIFPFDSNTPKVSRNY